MLVKKNLSYVRGRSGDAHDWLQEKEEIMTRLTVASHLQSYSFEWRTFFKKQLEMKNSVSHEKFRSLCSSKYQSHAKPKIDFASLNESEISSVYGNRRKSIKFLDCAICAHKTYIKQHYPPRKILCIHLNWTDVTKSVTGTQTIRPFQHLYKYACYVFEHVCLCYFFSTVVKMITQWNAANIHAINCHVTFVCSGKHFACSLLCYFISLRHGTINISTRVFV